MKDFVLKLGIVMSLSAFLTTTFAQPQHIKDALTNRSCICCIDGGGTKTHMQFINSNGDLLSFYKDDEVVESVYDRGCNINTIGQRRVKKIIEELFEGIEFGNNKVSIDKVKKNIVIVAGLAGFGTPDKIELVKQMLVDLGFTKENLFIYSDAGLLLESFNPGDILLISGTGSNCMGKDADGTIVKAGGLGKLLGDEGSGYAIGLQAIKKVLEVEQGWGEPTKLTQVVQKQFKTENLSSLIAPLQQGSISAEQIASLAPHVFDEAKKDDTGAMYVIYQAAYDLGKLLDKMLKKISAPKPIIYLTGGIFEGEHQDWFIWSILQSKSCKEIFESKEPEIKLLVDRNPAIVAALKFLSLS